MQSSSCLIPARHSAQGYDRAGVDGTQLTDRLVQDSSTHVMLTLVGFWKADLSCICQSGCLPVVLSAWWPQGSWPQYLTAQDLEDTCSRAQTEAMWPLWFSLEFPSLGVFIILRWASHPKPSQYQREEATQPPLPEERSFEELIAVSFFVA